MRVYVCLALCGYCLCLSVGCSHTTERRVVQAFSESLKEHDLSKLKEHSSDDFERKVIHGDETFEVLKMADLPDGKPKIVKIARKKDEDTKKVIEKRVIAEVGEKKDDKRRVQFVLKREPDGRRWVVDEVYLSGEDLRKGRSVGARADVLASLRESLEAWSSAEREQILAAATPEFAEALSELSPAQLSQFAKRITTDVAEETGVLSQERLGEETAELSVPKLEGDLVFSFRRVSDRWKLDDLKVKSRKGTEAIDSVRHLSAAMAAAQSFQAAYSAADKQRLQVVCTPRFYNGSLETADLESVPLPVAATGMDNFDVKLEGTAATFVIPAGDEVIKLSLVRDALQQIHDAPHYRVDDVTIFELKSSQDKRLSALFTGRASLAGFSAALAAHDVKTLQQYATHDFNERAWKHLSAEDFPQLPLNEIEPVPPRVVETLFKGSLTEMLVEQGSVPLTYVLRDEGGRLLVDDVLVPVAPLDDIELAGGPPAAGFGKARPESLKANLELLRPVLRFTAGLDSSRLDLVRGIASDDFARLVWNHYDEKTPEFEYDPLPYLRAPLTCVNLLPGDRAELLLGNRRFGAQVVLIRENGDYRVDDVWLISEKLPDQKVGLRRTIRAQIARRR